MKKTTKKKTATKKAVKKEDAAALALFVSARRYWEVLLNTFDLEDAFTAFAHAMFGINKVINDIYFERFEEAAAKKEGGAK